MANCGGSCSLKSSGEEDKVKVLNISIGKAGIVTDVKCGRHTFHSDETNLWGGNDSYPDPFDYIIGGLGSCIAISIRQYATKHFIMLDRAEVTLEYSYDEKSDETPYKIKKTVKLFGNLNDEERERLLLISDSPSQKMLERGIEIESILDKDN